MFGNANFMLLGPITTCQLDSNSDVDVRVKIWLTRIISDTDGSPSPVNQILCTPIVRRDDSNLVVHEQRHAHLVGVFDSLPTVTRSGKKEHLQIAPIATRPKQPLQVRTTHKTDPILHLRNRALREHINAPVSTRP